jgi:hypothetical protein
MARMPDTHRRAVTMALHRQWGAEPRPTDFMVHATQPGSFDDLEDALRRPVTPKIVRPPNHAFESLEIPAPARPTPPPSRVVRDDQAPYRPPSATPMKELLATSLCFLEPAADRPAAPRPHWRRSIRRRHLRQMQGAGGWAFLGWCLGMITAKAWGWL